MDFLVWLQDLGRTADPLARGFQAKPLYLLLAVVLPAAIGLLVGFGLRAIERILGVKTPGAGGH